jgi:HSP20 family protein
VVENPKNPCVHESENNRDGRLVVKADVPGLDPKDVEVSVLGNVLTIKGERKSESEVKKADY